MKVQRKVYWQPKPPRRLAGLSENITVDVAVVGGGMAGLTVAQEAAERGYSVALLEQANCGAGASGKSSGFITPDSELELSDLVRAHGEVRAKQLWEFVRGGVDHIRTTLHLLNFDCDYKEQDSLFIAPSARGFRIVQHEHAVRQKLGYESTLYNRKSIASVIDSDRYYGGVRYGGTFGINAYAYCQQLKDYLLGKGVRIYEGTKATRVADQQLQTEGGFGVRATHIVVCTDWALPRLGILKRDVYHAQTFLGITQPLTAEHQKQLFPQGPVMVWDTNTIYYYFRLTGDGRLLLGAASLLYTYWPRALVPPVRMQKALSGYLEQHFPYLPEKLEYLWPGLIGVSPDFAPLAGQHQAMRSVYFIAGAAGLPWAAALGRYIVEKIASDRSDFDQVFSPRRRFPLPRLAQSFLPAPLLFALSHGVVKYLRK